jgi:hypothetical protein
MCYLHVRFQIITVLKTANISITIFLIVQWKWRVESPCFVFSVDVLMTSLLTVDEMLTVSSSSIGTFASFLACRM